MTHRILFICLGNICRSPTAEGVLRGLAAGRDVDLEIDSAGTSNWHEGEPPCPPMIRAAAARGYDIASLRARQLCAEDFDRFDLIVAMDDDNIADAEAMRPAGARARLAKFTDYAPETGAGHVPDAYYTRDYTGALDLIETCAKGLMRTLDAG